MADKSIANLAHRGVQVLFSIIILGLSGHLVATQVFGGSPSTTNYAVFVGIWTLVIALIGIAASFVSALGGIVMLALDALSVLFTFAAGVALAVKLRVHSCSCKLSNQSCTYLVNNPIINGGKDKEGRVGLYVNRVGRCHEAQADTAFIWFIFVAFVGSLVLSLLAWRRGGAGGKL